MQNLNVEETNQKNKKFKHEIKNGERNKNVVMQGTVDNIITSEDATKVVQEFERFVSIAPKFGVIISTIVFKIALVKLVNNYPKMTKYLKTMIREIYKENGSGFK